jgi:Pyridoxamine 5'-phosphate oxidase
MGKVYESIDESLERWIGDQKVFFVATAPLSGDGHINCSPKDGASLRVHDGQTVIYQDFTGSGAETIAHVRENGRIILMLCAFDGSPKIVRLHGLGEVIDAGHPDFGSIAASFPHSAATRCFIRIRLTRISDSCGFGVPFYDFRGFRPQLQAWAEKRGPEWLEDYQRKNNARSIDGLPAMAALRE